MQSAKPIFLTSTLPMGRCGRRQKNRLIPYIMQSMVDICGVGRKLLLGVLISLIKTDKDTTTLGVQGHGLRKFLENCTYK